MKLKIDDIYLNNSFKQSINIERRVVVTVPYENKFYLLISEMNLTFKENNQRLFGIQTTLDIDSESDDTVLEKSYDSMQELVFSMKKEVINYLENCNQDRWIKYCKTIYEKNKKDFTENELEKQKIRFLKFNKATSDTWLNFKRESFIIGDDQDLHEWNVFWKYIDMQKFSERLKFKTLVNTKTRKI